MGIFIIAYICVAFLPNYFYYSRGNSYFQQGDYRNAIVSYDRAIRFDTDDPYSFHNRALAYNSLDNQEQAPADYDRAIELSLEFVKAYVNRGLLYEALDRTNDAINDFEKILEISTDPGLRQAVEKELRKLKGR